VFLPACLNAGRAGGTTRQCLCNMCSEVCHPGLARPVPALCPPSGAGRRGRAGVKPIRQGHEQS
jgi:hypothetical protein